MGIYNVAATTGSKSGSSSFSYILIIVVIFAAFYFLMIRPQQRRRQQAMQKQNTVTPGARVRTTAGMYATVVAVDGDDVVLEVAPGIEVRYMKRAIMDVVSPGDADTSEPEEEEPAEDQADDIEAEAPEEPDDSEESAYQKATGTKND
jgi:preprotein translocase subunit YajC